MFRKLKTKFVVITVSITTAILILAFGSIFAVVANNSNHRSLPQPTEFIYTKNFNEIVRIHILRDRDRSLSSLAFTLISIGSAVEIVVFIIAYLLADLAIRPVKEAYDAQKTFIANASHEIKTPLAAIQANLEAADIQNNHWIDNISAEVAHLATVNGELLALARSEAISEAITLENIAPESEIKRILTVFEPKITKNHQKISITASKSLKIKTNKHDFIEISRILIDNAIKYGNHDITIKITEKQLQITNDGTTISPEHLSKIFDRFYQTNKSNEGVGLGLSIAKSLADRNHWHLSAASSQSAKTTTFTIDF